MKKKETKKDSLKLNIMGLISIDTTWSPKQVFWLIAIAIGFIALLFVLCKAYALPVLAAGSTFTKGASILKQWKSRSP